MNASSTMTIGGKPATSAATIPVIDPATGDTFAVAPDATCVQLDEAVNAARHAFAPWSATPLAERQAMLGNIAGVLMGNLDTLSTLLTQEQGKPLARAREEIMLSAHWCAEIAKMAPETTTLEDTPQSLVQVHRVPLGVVGAIVPWNFPVALAFFKISPALLAGNTVVLKPSPNTPLTALKLGELLRDVLPPGVLNVISGGDALGPWMSAHPGINKISFTGSSATGRKVMEGASATLKRLTLELGGNDAAIVMPDVDVDAIAPVLFWGAFANSAQFCLAIKRLYIHEAIYDKLAAALANMARQVKLGRGSSADAELGPVQNRALFERLKDLLADCQTHGYRVLAGGAPTADQGYFFPVTLIDNPPEDSRIVQEEPFGPLLPLLRFNDVEEVIERANRSPYGLGGSVWCKDQALALSIAKRLQTGTVWVNEIHTLSPHKPMAGHKQSGLGVEQGMDGLLAYTQPQTISVKRATA